MKRLAAILWVLGLAAAAGSAEEQKQADANASPLLEKGPLQEARKALGPIFAFSFDGDRLKIDRRRWPQAAAGKGKKSKNIFQKGGSDLPLEVLFWQIAETTGFGGSISSGGGGMRDLHLSNGKLNAGLRVRGDAFRISLEEVDGPSRTFNFRDDGQGAISLQMTHPDGAVLLLNQARGGRCTVVIVTGEEVFRGSGESFLACFRKHRKTIETQVLPVLEHYRIQLFVPPQSPPVRQTVLALLARTSETQAEGQRLLGDLDSKDFATRETASQRLNERFVLFEDLIRQKLREKTTLELRRRLDKIVEDHADAPRVGQTVAALDLLQDAGYLVSLLDGAGTEDITRLIGRLEKVTGQKLGTDPAAWKEWAKKSQK